MELARLQARGQVTVPKSVREAADMKPGDLVAFVVTSRGRVELRSLPRLRLADALRRFRIEGLVDDSGDREEWQAEAAQDVVSG